MKASSAEHIFWRTMKPLVVGHVLWGRWVAVGQWAALPPVCNGKSCPFYCLHTAPSGGLLPVHAEASISVHLCHLGAESVREKHQ